ncbi:E3 ubiquitin-protein ligase SH3RF3-like [Tigriopus californicus]|uniref:E3 ubiquitin-protein ligase SH3RF3-like n=1 Tax=Tigriopus californicus TaxID=6832 RepID=UPI0027DAAA0C|nr:E3 ubiquitin-protein ligase SH3RF3-like [Tigriopus californicus]
MSSWSSTPGSSGETGRPRTCDMGDLGDLLECSVCLDTLGRNHKVLPCQHTFCTSCLTDVYRKNPQNFLCPECRTPCPVSLERLPSNVILNRILEGMSGDARRASLASARRRPDGGSISTNPFLRMIAGAEAPTTPPTSFPTSLAPPTPPVFASWGWDMSTTPSPQSPVPTLPPKPGVMTQPPAAPPSVPIRPHSTPNAETETLSGPPLYRALYNYEPTKLDELELVKGELYMVSEKCQDGWFKGSSVQNFKSGVFPGNYVQHVKHDGDPRQPSPQAVEGSGHFGRRKILGSGHRSANNQPNGSSQPVSSQDLIDLTHDTGANFFATTSTIVPPNVTTHWAFPKASSDTALSSQSGAPPPGSKPESTPKRHAPLPPPPSTPKERYRCTTAFPASCPYELNLKEGDVVIVFKKRDDGWAKGSLDSDSRKVGLFPMTFVQKL